MKRKKKNIDRRIKRKGQILITKTIQYMNDIQPCNSRETEEILKAIMQKKSWNEKKFSFETAYWKDTQYTQEYWPRTMTTDINAGKINEL